MEKEFNRERQSYRPRRNDSREDYQGGNSGRMERRRPSSDRGDFRNRQADNDRRDGQRREYKDYGNRERKEHKDYGSRGRREYKDYGARGKDYAPSREGEASQPERKRRPRIGEVRQDRSYRRETSPREEFMPHRNYMPGGRKEITEAEKEELRRKHYSKKKVIAHNQKVEGPDDELRLNRYIAMSGICSRRDADELIVAGRVKVNGVLVQTVGQKVKRSDKVEVDDNEIIPERKVYIVLNKPKDYVTTVDDPLERKTVMSLVEKACKERIYPVGRLDRQTTGVLLLTNDGDLAKKLTHPKFNNKKIYHVFLDKPLLESDFNAISQGIELEDGFIKADEIQYVKPDGKEVGIEIHSGRNRIVRRIFEHLGYKILKLDRVYFAGITKKNLPRGKWRFLSHSEVNILKAY